jgi:protein phosphatase PTC7
VTFAIASRLVSPTCSFSSSSYGAATEQAPSAASPALAFVAESAYVPSPDKANGGEDALFASRYALAVADGVGGWSDSGVDSGRYSRALLAGARKHCDAALASGAAPDGAEALERAHASLELQGSSTACLVVAGRAGAVRVTNLGDSGATLWRRARPASLVAAPLRVDEAARLWEQRYASPTQQHFFNCPFQLSAVRDMTDRVAAGVVNAPVAAQVGDLVIAATDGLWDNLAERDIGALLARFDFEACSTLARLSRVRFLEALKAERDLSAPAQPGAPAPLERLKLLGLAPEVGVSDAAFAAKEKECRAQLAGMASLLAATAVRVGGDKTAKTPFALNAAREKLRWSGGKLDDTAVICALVVADEAHFDVFG